MYLRGEGKRSWMLEPDQGVLSIASRHLGANQVYAYDLDEVAVRAAKENMALNPVAEAVNVAANDLLTGIEIEADIIVANILADIILLMIPDAWRLLKPTGTLIVSGIIEAKKTTCDRCHDRARICC